MKHKHWNDVKITHNGSEYVYNASYMRFYYLEDNRITGKNETEE
jgi:hypothetical protein